MRWGTTGIRGQLAIWNVWITVNKDNAAKAEAVLRDFGMSEREVATALFEESGKIISIGG